MKQSGHLDTYQEEKSEKRLSLRAWYHSARCSHYVRRGVFVIFAFMATGCVSQQSQPDPHPNTNDPPHNRSVTTMSHDGGGWLTFGYDETDTDKTGDDTVSLATVSRLHRSWQVTLPDLADERPILVPHLAWSDGTVRDILYLTTDKGTLLALDAASGTQLWAVKPKSTNPKYTKSTPATDPAAGLIYSYGLDGKVHRFRMTTGQEVPGNGWPVRVTTMPLSEKVSAGLTLTDGYLYVTTASFSGDAPPYQGHLVAINVATGATHIFNSLCNDHHHLLAPGECAESGGGIWARSGVVVDPVTGHIFFAVSDGEFTANHGGADWGDSIIEMTRDGATIADSYTPTNYATEAFQNRDIGSVAPALLPAIPQSHTPLLAVQAGKEGVLRVLNRQNLSGQGKPAQVGGEVQSLMVPDGCPVLAQPIAWKAPKTGALWLYVATSCQTDAYQVLTSAQGVTTLHLAWSIAAQYSSPILVSGVLFAASSFALQALDPTTGHTLWSSTRLSAGGGIGAIHWESPIFVGGRLYCTDEDHHLMMYQL